MKYFFRFDGDNCLLEVDQARIMNGDFSRLDLIELTLMTPIGRTSVHFPVSMATQVCSAIVEEAMRIEAQHSEPRP